jgi:phenylacetate-CoA ligase
VENYIDMIRKLLVNLIAKKNGDDYSKEYRELNNRYKSDSIELFQNVQLTNLIKQANLNSKYYQKIFSETGVINNNSINLSNFNKIPILTKNIIRENIEEIYSKDYTTRKWYYNSSGGSTGEPLRLIQDTVYSKWGNAMARFYYNNFLNIDEPYVKKIILWGAERDLAQGERDLKIKFNDWMNNTIFLNSFLITESDMARYINIINSYRPVLLRGYAGSLYEISKYIEKNDLSIHSPKIIISAAETLHKNMREKIESVFGRKVYDYYGSREIGHLAGECKKGYYHTLFWNYFEVLDKDNNPVQEGEEGRIIVTNFFNYSMPLIRYEIGDMAIRGPDKCPCGKLLPTLIRITGRITDHFKRKDGSIIHGEYFTHLFYLKDWVQSFQIIQENFERIKILIVKKSEINPIEKSDIENKIKLVMGNNCIIKWDIVDQIPKTKTGKYLFTKSEIR